MEHLNIIIVILFIYLGYKLGYKFSEECIMSPCVVKL